MKKQLIYSCLIFSVIVSSVYLYQTKQTKETIIFFPIDPSFYFEHASTHLLSTQMTKDTYTVQWTVDSTLNEPAYLRQDLSLLYKNGKLTAIINKWKLHTQTLTQKKKLKESNIARYDAVTFHYAEIHRNEDTYTSVQQMSKANLYVIPGPFINTFERPLSERQKQWQAIIDTNIATNTVANLNKTLQYFQLNKTHYHIYSLTDLPTKANQIFQAFPNAKQEEIIGKLWEGIYKNYILGIKKEDGSLVRPEGSSIPQLLVANDHTEILVLFTLEDGTPIILRQTL